MRCIEGKTTTKHIWGVRNHLLHAPRAQPTSCPSPPRARGKAYRLQGCSGVWLAKGKGWDPVGGGGSAMPGCGRAVSLTGASQHCWKGSTWPGTAAPRGCASIPAAREASDGLGFFCACENLNLASKMLIPGENRPYLCNHEKLQ